jgi:hypothetical protein
VQANREQLTEVFGFSIEELQLDLLNRISVRRPVQVLDYLGAPFKGCVMRITPPNGAFYAHVGNQFLEGIQDYQRLADQVDFYDQVSFFLLIERPERGGVLQLYDLQWEDTPNVFKHFPGMSTQLREQIFERYYRGAVSLPVDAGDMVVFAGGRIWHKVADVKGETNRVTVGGFIAKSRNQAGYYIWS